MGPSAPKQTQLQWWKRWLGAYCTAPHFDRYPPGSNPRLFQPREEYENEAGWYQTLSNPPSEMADRLTPARAVSGAV